MMFERFLYSFSSQRRGKNKCKFVKRSKVSKLKVRQNHHSIRRILKLVLAGALV